MSTVEKVSSSAAGVDAAEAERQVEESFSSFVTEPEFCFRSTATKSLNVTCFGSSSSKTPEKHKNEAKLLGYILAKRGHVCINGAGEHGCMAAMNDGVHAGDGHVRGVTHEMFVVDNGDNQTATKEERVSLGEPSGHPIFDGAVVLKGIDQLPESSEASNNTNGSPERRGPIRELIVAGGDDLQERKKFLVACADALIVLPGGPGTWDELWEMACARHLGLNTLPIVCVNVDGYYEPFREMLHRAYEDKLIHMEPEQIIWFADTAEDAVRFVENPAMETSAGRESSRRKSQQHGEYLWWGALQTFVVGAMFGIILSGRSHR